MRCRHCGTEIADKAIICFRCGAGTTDPVRKAVPIRTRRSPLVPAVLVAILLLTGLYAGSESRTAANPEWLQIAAGLAFGMAVLVLIFGILRRR